MTEYFICFRGDAGIGGLIAKNVYDTLSEIYGKKVFFSSAYDREKGHNYRDDEDAALRTASKFIIILTENFFDGIQDNDDEVRYELMRASSYNNMEFYVVAHCNRPSKEKWRWLREIVNDKVYEKISRAEQVPYQGVNDYVRYCEPELCRRLLLDDKVREIARNGDKKLQAELSGRLKKLQQHSGSYYLAEITKDLFPSLGDIEITYESETGNKSDVPLYTVLTENRDIDYLLIGDGGIGKTVLLMATCQEMLKHNIPAVFLPLHTLHGQKIKDVVLSDKPELKEKFMSSPYGVLLLDGFNEVAENCKEDLLLEVIDLSQRTNLQLVISSRFDPGQFSLSFDDFGKFDLQPLTKEKVIKYLNDCDIDIPEENTLEVLNYPLMLTLYTSATKYKSRYQFHETICWKNAPSSNGEIIWNFMQTQLHKIAFEQGHAADVANYVFVLEYVIPSIAYDMVEKEIFEINKSNLREAVKKNVEFFKSRWRDEKPERITDVLFSNSTAVPLSYEPQKVWDILTKDLRMMYSNANGNYSFYHQHFRDSLAAIHMINMAVNEKDYPHEWQKWVPHNVLKPVSELMEKKILNKLTAQLRGKDLGSEDFSVFNVLDVYQFWYKKDFRAFNFSDLDLRNVYLRDCDVSGARFDGAKISYPTFLQQGHSGSIFCLAVSSDGKYFVSGSYDNSIIIWDTLSARFKRRLDGHGSVVTSVALDNGYTLFSASQDGIVYRWDIASGNKILLCEIPNGVKKLTICDGYLLLLSGSGNLYKISSCQSMDAEISKLFSDVTSFAYDKQSGHIAISLEGGAITVYKTEGDRLPSRILTDNKITCLCFMRGGDWLFCGCEDGRVLRANPDRGIYYTIGFHGAKVNDIVPYDNKTIITASDDETMCLWDFENEKLVTTYKGHYRAVLTLAVSEMNRVLISGSDDNTIRLWNVDSGKQLKAIEGYTDWINGICFADKADLLMTVSGDTSVRLWSKHNLKWKKTFNEHTDWVYCGALSEDGKIAATCACDKNVIVRNCESGEMICKFEGHTNEVKCVCLTKDGKIFASAGADGKIFVVDVFHKKTVIELDESPSKVYWVILSSNGEKLIYCTSCRRIVVIDVRTSDKVYEVKDAHSDKIHCMALNEQAGLLISGGNDHMVKIWQFTDGSPICEFKVEDKVRCVALNKSATYCVAGALDGTIYIRNMTDGSINSVKLHKSEVRTVAFLSDDIIVSGSSDSYIKIYNIIKKYTEREIKPVPLMNIKGCSFINAEFSDEYLKNFVMENGGKIIEEK